jgi:hypothetical protein
MMEGLSMGVSGLSPNVRQQIEAVVTPPSVPARRTTNQYYDQRSYNLTTQSVNRPGSLAQEFDSMAFMASR